MSALGDALKAIKTVSSSFPPLQAALGLAIYVDDSIDESYTNQFKSNAKEIEAIALYGLRLSEVLERHNSVHRVNTDKFLQVIVDIQAYCKKVAKRNGVVQYMKRTPTAGKLRGYRDRLWEEFAIFSIEADVDVQEFQKAAEEARKEDERIAQAAVQKLSQEIKEGKGVPILAQQLGVKAPNNEILKELQAIHMDPLQPPRSADDEVVLRESIHLSAVLFPPQYKWFKHTFAVSRGEAKTILAPVINDLVGELRDSDLISAATQAEIGYESNAVVKAGKLLQILDGRGRDIKLIRTVQRWLMQEDDTKNSLTPELLATA
ncbi:hypothetical protein C8R46DRAFT_1040744 [Mycena filopes]|nr:hypothetical protein C8R46DRAFT_1040744 [Mycena filopes]